MALIDFVPIPVKKRKKPIVTKMPSAGSGGSSGYIPPHPGRHVQPHIGSPSDPVVAPTSVSHVTPSGHRVTVYPSSSPSSVPASHAVSGSRTPALSAADKQRIQAVQSLATAQKQIAKLSKQPKVKIPKPPKLQKLKAQPAADIKLAQKLTAQIPKSKSVVPGTKAHTIRQASRRLVTYATLPKAAMPKAVKQAPVPKVKAAKPSKPKAVQKASSAKLTKSKHPYVFPFKKGQYTQSRTDMGVDFTGTGPISAMGKAKVLAVGASGWPNGGAGPAGQGVDYKLLKGPKKGKIVFVREGVTPTVSAGQTVKKGQQIAKFYPGSSIEQGYVRKGTETPGGGQTQAQTSAQGYSEGQVTAAGTRMAKFLGKAETGGSFASGKTGSNKPPSAKEVRTTISGVAGKGPQAKALAAASIKYGRKYGIPPSVLFAQQGIESGWGANTGPSTANAQGYTQFIPSTRQMILDKYGVDAYGSPAEAVHAQALLLRDAGAKSDLSGAVFSYNHSSSYVADVLGNSKAYTPLDKASGRVYTLPGPPGTSGTSTTSGTTSTVTSGTTSTPVTSGSTASGTTSRGTAANNRARLLRAVNKNRKKAASAIGSYRKGLSPTSPQAPAPPSSPSTSSGTISLGL